MRLPWKHSQDPAPGPAGWDFLAARDLQAQPPPAQEPVPNVSRSMWKRFLLGGAIVVLLTTAATSTAALLQVKEVADVLQRFGGPSLDVEDVITAEEAGDSKTILLIGSDERYIDIKNKNPSRSDTILLLRLNKERGVTSLMSIPRDLKVRIPGVGTDKINAAYAYGGPKLTIKTIKQTLGIKINHVININFGGFRRAVDRLGGIYVDVDRDYFNDNTGAGPNFASIDVNPGYRLLRGQDALDYVRYRHTDTDLVRGARQQDFLRLTKEQIGAKRLVEDRNQLLRIFAKFTESDRRLKSTKTLLRLLFLVGFLADKPVAEVPFEASLTGSYVEATEGQLQRNADRFLNARIPRGPRGTLPSTREERKTSRKRSRKGKSKGVGEGLEDALRAGGDQAIKAAPRIPFKVYYPRYRTRGAQYAGDPYVYRVRTQEGKVYRAYRMVLKTGARNEYYGVQGLAWTDPPILRDPSETRTLRGRKFDLYYDGTRLRLVAWHEKEAVYWVSNTLLRSLSNKQMLAIAKSTRTKVS